MAKTFHYGGQALIEGVMMRGQRHQAIAVRLPDGGLSVTCEPIPRIYTGRLREFLFLRGIIILVETLSLGMKALFYSANAQLGKEEELSKGSLWGTLTLALGFAVALFFVTPLLLARLLGSLISSALIVNIIEGFIRLGILIAYLWSIGLSKEISRVFAYHGAEHKAVNAYEAGVDLEVAKVKGYSTAHARCGTSFLLAVVIVAIFVFALFGRPSLWLSIVLRIVLLPVIASLGYEFIRLSAARANTWFMRPLMAPGLALQSMTTRDPDGRQLEVAISALREVIRADSPLPQPQIVTPPAETGSDAEPNIP